MSIVSGTSIAFSPGVVNVLIGIKKASLFIHKLQEPILCYFETIYNKLTVALARNKIDVLSSRKPDFGGTLKNVEVISLGNNKLPRKTRVYNRRRRRIEERSAKVLANYSSHLACASTTCN